MAEIIFTSGATGEPKGVVITHRNVLANILPVEREVRKYRAWARPVFPLRFLNLLPLSHMFGQAMATFIPPMLPGVVVFMRGYNPADITTLIRRVDVKITPDGEILVRGENVTSGYFQAEAETAKAFEGGWFHTVARPRLLRLRRRTSWERW